jgi:peptidoglycan/LPS O-acetylase OafA/YrhL
VATNQTASGKKQLPALTGTRFFLALWVILYHQIPHEDNGLAVSWLGDLPLPLHLILRCGYAAVTVFFVLSGFVLAYNYDLGAPWDPRTRVRFWAARFARIYPAYAAGLLLLVPFALYRVAVLQPIPSAQGEARAAFLNFFLLQAWHPYTALTWNYPGWSLSDEAFFYAAFPLIGIWLWRIRRPWIVLAVAAFLWVLSMAAPWMAMGLAMAAPVDGFGNIPASTIDIPDSASFAANLVRYNPLLRLPEFAAGILMARLYRHWQGSGHFLNGRGYWLYIPGLLAAALVLGNADQVPYALVHNGLLLPPYACIILGFALDGGWLARWFSWRPLVFLGNASYSMYILHIPIQVWLLTLLRRVFSFEPHGLAWVAVYAAAVVAISGLFFVRLEEPAHRWLRDTLRKRIERRFQHA